LSLPGLRNILFWWMMGVKHDGMTGCMVEPIRIERRKLFEQVAFHLEQQIVSGRLKAGDRLPAERDLCQLFGVGRPAIREALISLQKQGLVELRNGASARVAAASPTGLVAGIAPAVRQMLLSPDGQRNFQRVRAFVEVGLARHAARHATEEDLARIEAALVANEAALGDVDRFVATDIAFHFEFALVMDNPVFTAVHDALSTWLVEQRRVTLAAPGQARTACEAHRRIYEAVRRRDPDAAEAAMAEHMDHVAALFRQLARPA
jgi:GntR family transcriptional repressor for pyruvate dehydrogenase complex